MGRQLYPGQAYTAEFATAKFSTGAAFDATGTPTATAAVNGTDNAWSLTVENVTTGVYKVTGTVPTTFAAGDHVDVRVAASVDSVPGVDIIDSFDIPTNVLAAGTAQGGAAGYLTAASGAITADNKYRGDIIHIVAGTGKGQFAIIGSSTTADDHIVPLKGSFDTAPDNTSKYVILSAGEDLVTPINSKLADGVAHGGSTATATFRKVIVANSTGGEPAIGIHATGAGGQGMLIDSDSGEGINIQGGTNKDGILASGDGIGIGLKTDPIDSNVVSIDDVAIKASYIPIVTFVRGVTSDTYIIQWYKIDANGTIAINSGITDSTFAYQDTNDEHVQPDVTPIVALEGGAFSYEDSSDRLAAGIGRLCYISATIDADTRTGTYTVRYSATGA